MTPRSSRSAPAAGPAAAPAARSRRRPPAASPAPRPATAARAKKAAPTAAPPKPEARAGAAAAEARRPPSRPRASGARRWTTADERAPAGGHPGRRLARRRSSTPPREVFGDRLGAAARRVPGVPAPPGRPATTRSTSTASTARSPSGSCMAAAAPDRGEVVPHRGARRREHPRRRRRARGLQPLRHRPARRPDDDGRPSTTRTGRFLRPLGADLVFKMPVVSSLARKGGATLACNEDAERMLRGGELVGVWPEGFKGIGKPYSERYKLQRFGRGGFVSAALRTGVPIIPLLGRRAPRRSTRWSATCRRWRGCSACPTSRSRRSSRCSARSAWCRCRRSGCSSSASRSAPTSYDAGRGRRPDAGLQRHRPGARDDPADALHAAHAARSPSSADPRSAARPSGG